MVQFFMPHGVDKTHNNYTAGLPVFCAISRFCRNIQGSRSFKVTNFGANRKPVCDFLLVNITGLHPISHSFQVVVADYWSKS